MKVLAERIVFTGYYNRPWEWEQIKHNTQWIIQFGSTDDPFIPFSEQKQVAEGTGAEFQQYSDKGHFMSMAFPELLKKLMENYREADLKNGFIQGWVFNQMSIKSTIMD